MSAAAAADPADASKKKAPKKMLVIVLAIVLLGAVGGGAAVFMMKKKAADAAAAEADGGEESSPAPKAHHDDKKAPPAFVPLDPFTVNLADKESERFAQVAVTLEVEDAHAADEIKNYMPAIRNGVLMILAHKTSTQILDRAGKERLAREIARESARAMGYEVDDEDEDEAADTDQEDAPKKAAAKKKKKKKKSAPTFGPIKRVLFSNIIIQ